MTMSVSGRSKWHEISLLRSDMRLFSFIKAKKR
jgi:hypothetical protein